MGLDANILFRCKPGFDPVIEKGQLSKLESWLPQDFEVAALTGESGDFTDPPGATHCIVTGQRYYSESYHRGPWPNIASVLMTLLATKEVEKVWYGNDHGVSEITPEFVLKMSAHWMQHGNGHFPFGTPPTKP